MSGTLAARGTQSTVENASARQRAHAQSRTASSLDEMADATELQTISALRGNNWADYSTVALTDFAASRGSVTTDLIVWPGWNERKTLSEIPVGFTCSPW